MAPSLTWRGALALSSLVALVTASPVHHPQSPFNLPPLPSTTGDEVNTTYMEALLDKYAPVVKLSSLEAFYPSSIEYMLPHYTFVELSDGQQVPTNLSLLTPEALDRLPNSGRDQFLSIPEDHNPQPFLDEEASYLFGPAGQEGGMKWDEHGRAIVEEDVYGFWVDRGRGVVDLWYWTFYPFNFGKPVGPFGVLGNHVGDWEHVSVRTINGVAVSADYHSHNGGAFSSGTVRWTDVPQHNSRPIAYSAAGSHGLWPTPGDHIFANLLGFRLVDLTDDDGATWDTKGRVVKARFWDGPGNRTKIRHGGDQAWLNFRGMWGNRGVEGCWWHKLVPICQLVDAPPGPNRWFGIGPDCVISPLRSEVSTYTLELGGWILDWAEKRAIATVKVEQMCARPRKRKEDGGDDDGDDDDDDDDDDGDDGDDVLDHEGELGRMADYIHDETKEEDLHIWAVVGKAPINYNGSQTIAVRPCSGPRSALKSYRITLCHANGQCTPKSHERKICTYSPGTHGYTFGRAAHVEDVDEWFWDVGT